jgi:hypothetical protein
LAENGGFELLHSAATGRGFALLDKLAPGSWSRDTDEHGQTRLRVVFETVSARDTIVVAAAKNFVTLA